MIGHKMEGNTIILVTTELLTKVFGMLTTIVVARWLGVEQFGLLAYAYALSEISLAVPDFGFDLLTTRKVAQRPAIASRFFFNISAIKAVLYVPAAGFCSLVILLSRRINENLFVVLVIFVAAAITHHLLFACSFFRAVEKMELEAKVRIIFAAFLLLSSFVVLCNGFGIKPLAVSNSMVSLLCLGMTILFLKKKLAVSLVGVSWRYVKMLIKHSAPLATMRIFIMIYGSLIIVILGFLKGDGAAGYYSAALKIIAPLYVIPLAVSGASLPAMSKAWKESYAAFFAIYQRCLRYLLLPSIPLTIGIFLLGEKVIIALFGSHFLPSGKVIRIMAICLIPYFLNQFLGVILISMNREKSAVVGRIIGAVTSFCLCLILIPHLSAIGAAVAWTIADSAVFFFQFGVLFKELRDSRLVITITRSCLGCFLMAAVLMGLNKIGVPLLPQVGFSALVYIATLFFLGELKTHEVRRAYEIIKDTSWRLFD
jgi:O-antigen/teichoic acid export membrane protein